MESTDEAEKAEVDENISKSFGEVGGSRDCFSISKTEFVPLIEAMGTVYCEEAHKRRIKKLEFDGKISNKLFG